MYLLYTYMWVLNWYFFRDGTCKETYWKSQLKYITSHCKEGIIQVILKTFLDIVLNIDYLDSRIRPTQSIKIVIKKYRSKKYIFKPVDHLREAIVVWNPCRNFFYYYPVRFGFCKNPSAGLFSPFYSYLEIPFAALI